MVVGSHRPHSASAWNAARRSDSSRSSRSTARSSSNGPRLDPPALVAPGARDRPVHEEGRDRGRDPRREDHRAVLLREDPRPARVHEERRVPGREEADRHGGSRGRGAEREGGRAAPSPPRRGTAGAEGARASAARSPAFRCAQDAMSVRGRRPERGEVAPDEVLEAVLLGGVERPDPLLGERERVRGAGSTCPPVARARGRASARTPTGSRAGSRSPQELVDLGAGPRRPGEERARPLDERRHVEVGRDLVHAPPPLLARPPDPRREERVVAPRDDVDRLAHQRALDHRAAHEGAVEVVPLEPVEARPEPDVRVRRVLVLDAADPLDRPREAGGASARAGAAREERPVQLALGEVRSGTRRR